VSAEAAAHSSAKYQEFEGCEACFHTGFSSRQPVMSHILIDHEAQGFIEHNVSGLNYVDTISEEAMQLYRKSHIPFSEVNKLKEI
jgi:type II secretory ATPase GspE/PulE/Tfp pilus assembly ATPase PilB-like protein